MVKRKSLLPAAAQFTTDSVAPPAFAAASGTMPLEVMLITLCFRGKLVPANGAVPDGTKVGLVPAVAASGGVTVGTVPILLGMVAPPMLKIWKSFLSIDPLPNAF